MSTEYCGDPGFVLNQVSKVADNSIDRLQARIALLEAELESIKPYVLLPGPMVPDLGRIALLEGLLQQVAHNATGIYVRKDLQAEIRKALGMEE